MLLLPLAWFLVVLSNTSPVFRTAISLPFILIYPGYLIFRLIAGYQRRRINWDIAAYSLGLSVIFLMVIGFLINEVGLMFHNLQPLSLLPIAATIALMTTILGWAASFRRPDYELSLPKPKHLGVIISGLCLPILAVGGATTLNNGGSNVLALIALGLAAIYFLIICWKNRDDHWVYPYVLYVLSLTLLLGTSMRGWNITGHDVMQEYQVFQLTASHSAWHMHFYQDAYNACLSITILPTVIQRVTGIADQYVYKFVTQLIFAMLAPILYLSLRRYVPAVMAFLAGFVYITFPTFLTDMAMLNRQEVAFICLGLALLVGLDSSMKRQTRSILGFIFLFGMVLSHYSTSYVMLGILLIVSLIRLCISIVQRLRSRPSLEKRSLMPIFPGTVIAATLLMLIAWNTLATQTSNNISATIVGILPNLPKIISTIGTPSTHPKLSSAEQVNQYAASMASARNLPNSNYYLASAVAMAPVTPVAEPTSPVTTIGATLHVSASSLFKVFDSIKQSYAKLIQALILLGLILVAVTRKHRYTLPSSYIIIGVASLTMIGLQVVLPSNLINYGLLRLIQQGLLLLAFPVIVASFWLLARLRVPSQQRHKVVALGLIAYFLILSGWLPAITGGYKPMLPVSNTGFYYEAYYTHQDEISADSWAQSNTPTGSRFYSDEFARRQMITYSNIFSQPTLVPGAIPIDSYVYLDDANTTYGNVPVYADGNLVFYSTPTRFLEGNKNLIYTTGSVQIYR